MTTAKIAVTQKTQGIQRFFNLLTVKDRGFMRPAGIFGIIQLSNSQLGKLIWKKFPVDFFLKWCIIKVGNNTGSLAEGIISADPGTPLFKK